MGDGQGQGGARLDEGGPAAWLAADLATIWQRLQADAQALGFSQIGVADVDLASAEPGLQAWLASGFHGGMGYMATHGLKRARPVELLPGTVRVITARMDYLPQSTPEGWQAVAWQRLARHDAANVSLYALGRDYHKVLRQRLQRLGEALQQAVGERATVACRPFTDSAPVLEVELSARSGIGWRGKHTLLLSREGGSMFFLGELFVNLPLPVTPPVTAHCGECTACIGACPTGAILAPYRLDARRCISYLTIEHEGPIPVEFRAALGNRIYGCDDCQLACPWNKYAQRSSLPDFDVRAPLASSALLPLWAWNEADFLRYTEGSAIRRIGHARWRRNLAVALGNAWRDSGDPALAQALTGALAGASPLLAEHIHWALAQHGHRTDGGMPTLG